MTYPQCAEAANEIDMNFGNGFVVTWTYDRSSGRYLRSFNGNQAELVSEEGETSPLAADTLVVMLATRFIEQAPAGGNVGAGGRHGRRGQALTSSPGAAWSRAPGHGNRATT